MKKTTLTIRFPEDLKKKIVTRAERDKRSFSDQSAYLIALGLEALERDEALLARIRAGNTQINPDAFPVITHEELEAQA